jgi:hypothetical protein
MTPTQQATSRVAELEERIASLERLLGVHQRERAEWVASLDLNNEEDDDHRARRLRRLRGALFTDLAVTPNDGEIEWRLGIVDRAIRLATNTSAPEHRLDALETAHASVTLAATRQWKPSLMPGAPTEEEHAQRVANAKRQLGEIQAEIERTRDELVALYEAA